MASKTDQPAEGPQSDDETAAGERGGPMARDSVSGELPKPWLHRLTIVIYATIVLLGVVVAATAEDTYIDSIKDLSVLIIGTAIGLIIAHAWAATVAQIVIRNKIPSVQLVAHNFADALWALMPTALAVFALLAVKSFSKSYLSAALVTELLLTLILVLTAFGGAHRTGLGWGKSLGLAAISALMGLAAVIVKFIF
jgi:hypothetical protein